MRRKILFLWLKILLLYLKNLISWLFDILFITVCFSRIIQIIAFQRLTYPVTYRFLVLRLLPECSNSGHTAPLLSEPNATVQSGLAVFVPADCYDSDQRAGATIAVIASPKGLACALKGIKYCFCAHGSRTYLIIPRGRDRGAFFSPGRGAVIVV